MLQRVTIDAFPASPETKAVLAGLQGDRLLGKARLEIHPGGLAGAVAHYAETPTPQVVVVEAGDEADLLDELDRLADVVVAGSRVVVVGETNDIGLYRAMLDKGVSDYLLRPLTPRRLAESLDGLFADPLAAPRGKVIAFWGARGGAGASTLAQNVAWVLGRGQKDSVIYVDLDLAFGASTLAFDLEAKQTAADALAHPARLDEVLMERCMVEHDDHLHVLASPADHKAHPEVTIDGVERLVELAARMAPLVVLDLPRLWCDWTEHLLTTADEVAVVATPDFLALRDVKTVMEALAAPRSGLAPAKLALNRVEPSRKTQLTPGDFTDAIKLTPALVIPHDPQAFGEAANTGRMVAEAAPASKAAAALAQLAMLLGGRGPIAPKASRWALPSWLLKKG